MENRDYGYLLHGVAPGPFRSERVTVRHTMPDIWHARFEGRWRLVHIQLKRCYIVYQGERITIAIAGV